MDDSVQLFGNLGLLAWFVLVSLVRALAITVFEVITDFNAEAGNPENGKV